MRGNGEQCVMTASIILLLRYVLFTSSRLIKKDHSYSFCHQCFSWLVYERGFCILPFKGKKNNMVSNSANKGLWMDYSVIVHQS